MTKELQEEISRETKGKVIESMEWVEDDGYWVMTFTDGTEMSIRTMAGIVRGDE